MESIKIIFFGSFQNYSVSVLEELHKNFKIIAVITTPPKLAGRHMELTKTEVQIYAEKNHIPVFPLEKLDEIPNSLRGPLAESMGRPDFLIVAGYSKLIPDVWLNYPKILPINMHPSLLPDYRGAFPAEWAIIRGEKETGVSLVTMTAEFDKGQIIAQEKIDIGNNDTRETLYAKLYPLGAELLIDTLPRLAKSEIKFKPQPTGKYFYARRITKDDGFIPWAIIKTAIEGKDISNDQLTPILKEAASSSINCQLSTVVSRVVRALSGWPGVWTTVKINGNEKRLKILIAHLSSSNTLILDTVQLEGKKPTTFKELQKYLGLYSKTNFLSFKKA